MIITKYMEHTDKHSVLINTVYFVFINILITSYTHIILAFQDGVTSHIAREQTLHVFHLPTDAQ